MKTLYLLFIFSIVSCNSETTKTDQTLKKDVIAVDTSPPGEIIDTLEKVEQVNSSMELPFLSDWWISDEEINKYFPNVIDTIVEKRQIVATRFREKPWPNIQLSTIRNTGTFDQIFLCTHDSSLQLIDSYYVGKARDMDGTSEGIEYKLLDKRNLYFEHIIWVDSFDTIDSLPHKRYTLHITEKGEIVERK